MLKIIRISLAFFNCWDQALNNKMTNLTSISSVEIAMGIMKPQGTEPGTEQGGS